MAAIDTPEVIKLLSEFGQRAALRGGNPYRARAYARAAESLGSPGHSRERLRASRPALPENREEAAMPVVETLKKITEKATGWARPGQDALGKLIRARKPQTYRFKDDGIIPNHPRWPLVIYRGAVRLDEAFDPAALFEELFESNGWGDTWRNSIYDYVHYHSRIHEVLGIARGHGKVQFGGLKGPDHQHEGR